MPSNKIPIELEIECAEITEITMKMRIQSPII